MSVRRLFLIMVLWCGAPASLLAQTVFGVSVQEGGSEVGAGVAVLVTGDAGTSAMLLTSDQVVGSNESAQYVLVDGGTGARMLGQVEVRDEESGLALLRVPGLRGTPARLALEASGEGRHVQVRLASGQMRNGQLQSSVGRAGAMFYRFTVRPEPSERGAPVMNNCGELLTVSRVPDGPGWTWLGLAYGVGRELEVVKSFLTEHGVAPEIAPEGCLSVEERLIAAEAERSALKERQAELEEAAAAAEEQVEKLGEIEAERRRLESQLQEQQAELEQRQEEAAEKEDLQVEWENERNRQGALIRYGGVAALALLVAASLALRARRRRLEVSHRELAATEEALAQATVDFPDLILTGQGPDCGAVRLKVNGNAVARSGGGQVVGRSSAGSDYVLDAGSVSRRHARLSVVNRNLMVEDLGSLNGTRVDGVRLKQGSPVSVREGTTLLLGDVRLVANFLEDARE